MTAIRTDGLVKDYGSTRALAGLDLEVREGEVYGFLGPNGAGKTTTIRILVDLIRPTGGSVTVLGSDPRSGGPDLRNRIGYLAGDFLVDGRQTGRELLTYLANLRGGVPAARVDELAERLDLDLDRRIKGLSRGNRQKIGVIQAFMHDPELLVLDEPTSGLDPLVQHTVHGWMRQAAAGGRTVFLSSHVLDEVDRTCDRVGVIRDGRLVAVEATEDLRQRSLRQVTLRFAGPPPVDALAGLAGVLDLTHDGGLVRLRFGGSVDALVKLLAGHEVTDIVSVPADLDEIFRAFYEDGDGR